MAIIKKLPLQDRPREKAIKNGIESLSDYELLAIILQSGCKDKSALQLAMELIICFKGLYNVFNTSIYELNKISGINNVKAIQIPNANNDIAATIFPDVIHSYPDNATIQTTSNNKIAKLLFRKFVFGNILFF